MTAAHEIARIIDTTGPANKSALGIGLHEAKLKEHGRVIEDFCTAMGINVDTAHAQISATAAPTHTPPPVQAMEDVDA
jgi:hypothetical protein